MYFFLPRPPKLQQDEHTTPYIFFNLPYLPIMDKRGGLECEVWVCVWGNNFGIRKALIGRIYTSFYVVPKRTIAYEAP